PKYYNYGFENFYATVIQRAYRNYKKRPESLAKQVWEVVRNDGTPDDMKFLRRIPTREYWAFGTNDLEQGYIIIRSLIWEVDWTDILKWPQNPKHYYIDKKLHKNFISISEYKKELGACDSPTSYLKFPALTQPYNPIIVDLLDMNNNCELVRRLFQISP
ncbi:hypothetical protein RhiirA1_507671, partial [Rhizophagus irregularis]